MTQVPSEPETGPPSGLPFDPQEWARRVAEARVRREAVLAGCPVPQPVATLPVANVAPGPRARAASLTGGRLALLSGTAVIFTAGLLTGLGLAEFTRRPPPLPPEVAGFAPGPTLSIAALQLPAPGPASPRWDPEAAMRARAPQPADVTTSMARRPAGAGAPLSSVQTDTLPTTLPIRMSAGTPAIPSPVAAPDTSAPDTEASLQTEPDPDGIDPELIRSLVATALAGASDP